MAEALQLEIVTPDKKVVDAGADEVQIPGKGGYLGILPGHAPLITEIEVGEIMYRSGGRAMHLAVAWGFAEVLPNKVTILAETAETAEQIDLARAEAARKRAEAELANPAADHAAAQVALKRAQTRIEVAKRAGS